MTIRRTWYRKQSDGTFFRNTGLVRQDQDRAENRLIPWRQATLSREWDEIFRAGVTEAAAIPEGDRYIDFNDSPEATDAWVKRFIASKGKIV